MSALSTLYIKEETLEILLKTIRAKGQKGISLTISQNDEINDYGQNVSAFVSQTKEESDAKKKKYYVGNGKVVWKSGELVVAPKYDPSASSTSNQAEQEDDLNELPF